MGLFFFQGHLWSFPRGCITDMSRIVAGLPRSEGILNLRCRVRPSKGARALDLVRDKVGVCRGHDGATGRHRSGSSYVPEVVRATEAPFTVRNSSAIMNSVKPNRQYRSQRSKTAEGIGGVSALPCCQDDLSEYPINLCEKGRHEWYRWKGVS